MEEILASMTVSISEFKNNPSMVVREAENNVFCVLSNNKPAFYVVTPEHWEQILDRLDDLALAPIINERLKKKDKALHINLKDVL